MVPEPSPVTVLLIASVIAGVFLVVVLAARALVAWVRRRRMRQDP